MERPPERNTTLPAEAAAELESVQKLRAKFEENKTILPILGSLCWEDRKLGVLGEQPAATARTKLAVAVDHAGNIRQLLLQDRTLPVWAHLTLVRPVFEGSVQTNWLLDPNVSAPERVGRAVGAAVGDLKWRRKAEDDARARGWTPSAKFQSAAAREKEVRDQAEVAGIAIVPMPDTSSLLTKYSLIAGSSDAYLWRYTSGVLHTQVWAALVGDVEHYKGDAFSWERHEADVELSGNIIVAAIRHLARAINVFVEYLEP
jgi:hypothetical protein